MINPEARGGIVNAQFFLFSPILLGLITLGQASESFYTLGDVKEAAEESHRLAKLCGPLSIAFAAQQHGIETTTNTVLRHFDFDVANWDGCKVSDMLVVATKLGLSPSAVRYPTNQLTCPRGTILFVDNGEHCLVFLGSEGADTVSIWDPSGLNHTTISRQVLEKKWDGEAIVFERNASSKWTVVSMLGALTVAILCVSKLRDWIRLRGPKRHEVREPS